MAVDEAIKQEQIQMAEELFFSGEPLPSFAKGLYAGIFDAKRVFPFPEPTAEQQKALDEYNAKLNAWMDENLDADAIDRNVEIPDSVVKGLGELGLLSCTIEKEYGGIEFTQHQYCKAVEEVARRCASTALFINAHQSIGMKAFLLYGTQKQKDTWLRKLSTGECLAAFALTEPEAGSDAGGVQTRAVYNKEKDVWVINGEKRWITNGGIADVLTLMARTEIDGQDKISAFIVTPDMPGFEVVEVAMEKVGMRGTKTARLKFTDMEVPNENILGKPGRGLHVALHVLDFGRTTFGATCTGSAKFCVEQAIERAKTRYQFKQPIGNFELVKEKIAKMAAYTYAIDAMTQLTAGLVDRGEEDYMLETAILKVFASDHQWQILYDTMQIWGGASFFNDQPFERMMRDARLNTIGEGSNDVLSQFIGLVGMRDVGMKFKDVADSIKSPTLGIGKMLGLGKDALRKYFVTPDVPVKSEKLKQEANKLGELVQQFGLTVQRLIVQYKEDILDNQLELNRIAIAAMNIYGMSAVLGKLDAKLARNECDDTELATGKFYCELALQDIESNLNLAGRCDTDKNLRGLAGKILGL
jgi:alkylation response protein AidB-like acyl-CoA dehydrogenase